MSMPGFTAEAAFRETKEHYDSTADHADVVRGQGVVPQFTRVFGRCPGVMMVCLYDDETGQLAYCDFFWCPSFGRGRL